MEIILLIAILGLCSGSFITMASYRFSLEGQKASNLLFARSACPHCKNELKVKNLIPLFSWISQKGKCDSCKKKISSRYPLIELFTAAIFITTYLAVGVINTQLILLLLMVILLMIMIITDLEHYFIPDITQIMLFVLAIFYHLNVKSDFSFMYYFFSATLFVAFGYALYYGFLFFYKKDALGIDDIKFFGVAGFLIGIESFPIFMMLTGIIGVIFGVIWQKVNDDKTFPFAPALVVSLMACLLYSKSLNNLIY